MQRHHPASTGSRRMQYIAFKHSSCSLPWHDCLSMQDTVESLHRPRRLISRNESRVGYPTPDYSPRTASQSAALTGGPATTDQSGASTFGSKGQPGENSPLPAIGITSSSCCWLPSPSAAVLGAHHPPSSPPVHSSTIIARSPSSSAWLPFSSFNSAGFNSLN